MHSVRVEDRQSKLRVDLEWLAESVRTAISAEQCAEVELVITLVDDAEMRRVNREFLDHDWATDVISFNYGNEEVLPASSVPRGQGQAIDGELIVSTETALRFAESQSCTPEAELLLYCVHGWLHLCGYDDLDDAERVVMRQREREILSLFGQCPEGLEE